MLLAGKRWIDGAAFGLLCLLGSSRWIVADTWPSMGSTLRSQAWACALVACVCVAMARRRQRPRLGQCGVLMLVGAGLLCLPAFGAALHGPSGAALNRILALCFVPIIVTVLGGIVEDGVSPVWWPGLRGLGGALLVFPLTLASSAWEYVGLLLPVVGVAVACVFVRRVAERVAPAWSAAWLLLGGMVGLIATEAGRRWTSGLPGQPFSILAVLLDAAVAGLAVFLVLRVGGLRYSARYFALPLVTIGEGLLVERSGMTLRLGLGMILLAFAAAGLWKTRQPEEKSSLLGLN